MVIPTTPKPSLDAANSLGILPSISQGYTNVPRNKRPQPPIFLGVWTGVTFLFLYLPIAVLIFLSFNDSNILSLPWRGITGKWYSLAFSDRPLMESLGNSLKVATAATVLATGFGLLTAWGIYRYQFWGRNTLRIAVNLPILLPGVVTGVAMLAYFSSLDLPLSLITVILGHGIFGLPVAMGSILTRLGQFPQSLAEAAADLGAKPGRAFWDVIFPYISSAVASGALLAFTLSFDEVIVTIFLTGRDNTLPLEIWARLRTDITPEIAAAATLVLLGSSVFMLLNQWVASRE